MKVSMLTNRKFAGSNPTFVKILFFHIILIKIIKKKFFLLKNSLKYTFKYLLYLKSTELSFVITFVTINYHPRMTK